MRANRGDIWENLCNLLDTAVPDQPWPHTNAAAPRDRRKKGLSGAWKRVRKRLRH